RQAAVLVGAARAGSFIHRAQLPSPATGAAAAEFVVVLPVLREAPHLRSTVEHLAGLPSSMPKTVVVVTTAREQAEDTSPRGSATYAQAETLAREGACVHLHSPDERGLKADQLNYVAQTLADGSDRQFLVCYDADSRPPKLSLLDFEHAIASRPGAHVFHQSSGFLAPQPPAGRRNTRIGGALAGAAAVRANRFVLGFELPRLMVRDRPVGAVRRRVAPLVYTHVTGHGLCVRMALLQTMPFARRSALEDMRFSFHACARGLEMVPVRSLDRAEVPYSLAAQAKQSARWFAGPARAAAYLRDDPSLNGWRHWALVVSALASSLEWLLCAAVPASTAAAVLRGRGTTRVAGAGVTALYFAQACLADLVLGSPASAVSRTTRIALSPLSVTVFGIGGIGGAARLLAGRTPTGKTERG
ncbi:MAG: hypothetical protein M3524_05410, partial [Actinomycetota bacterium]|nr:hypothetical protein [Actinomycetota bacterium]